MALSGEAVCVDGLATRVQRPCGWANQKVLYDTKRRAHTAQGLSVATIWGDLRGWTAAGRAAATSTSSSGWQGCRGCWIRSGSSACWTAGSAGWPRATSIGMRRSGTGVPSTGSQAPSGPTTACRRGAAGAGGTVIAHLANAWALRRWRGLLYRVRDVYRAVGALICLGRWLHRVPT